MAGRKFSNFYTSTIDSLTVGVDDSTMDVVSTAKLPALGAGEYCMCILKDDQSVPTKEEIIKVTAISGTTLTIEKGAEGTTKQSWVQGDYIALDDTAEAHEKLDGPEIVRYSEPFYTSLSPTISRANGGKQKHTSSTAETFSFDLLDGEDLTVHFYGLDTNAPTWPASNFVWVGGSEPTWSAAAVVTLWSDGTTTWAAYGGSI